ncbi:MAG: hypothetical protein ACXABY_31705, partial [Candidatus Thorarchaeota archaeon]
STSQWALKENIRTADKIFAERLELMWDIVDWRKKYAELEAKLTKPLDDYAHWYVGRRWTTGDTNVEYKHKGAQAAWLALRQIQRKEDGLALSSELLHDQTWDIDQLIQDAYDALGHYQLALKIARKTRAQKKAGGAARMKKKEEQIKKQLKLAKKPVVVSAVVRDDGTWINHLELRRNLTGRNGWLSIGERIVHITRFRQWLDVALRSTETNRRVRNLGQQDWLQVDLDASIGNDRTRELQKAIRFWSNTSVRFTAHFYDDTYEVEKLVESSARRRVDEPVIHTVELKKVKDNVHRTVWAPTDINKYRPALVAA